MWCVRGGADADDDAIGDGAAEHTAVEAHQEEEDQEAQAGGDEAKDGGSGSEEDEPPVFYVPSPEFASTVDGDQEEWSANHAKMLYLMWLYARSARSADDPEGWLRAIPLSVLTYEGITQGVLDFDYAPCSRLVSHEGRSKRVWMNITQEGTGAVDDLRDKAHVNGLKLSTEDFQPVTAYQVSNKGQDFVEQIPDSIKDAVHTFVYPPAEYPRELKSVFFDGEKFMLVTNGGYASESSISDAEDVSYVSSPYLPRCLRNPLSTKPLASNAHRAGESAVGENNIRDELSEAVVLGNVHGLVGEWIPFGSNQIVALNERLGALDRCQGGLFTAMVDKTPTDTNFAVDPGLTQVAILDFDFVNFINFEAEINFPEDDGVVQVENFGMHLNVDGTIVYGIQVEAILNRDSYDVSLDHLSRLLVDVHQDSSKIMNDLLSQYQRSLLQMIFMGDDQMRNKFNCIISEVITPKMPADEYLDRGDFENEIKQVLGDIRAAHDIGDENVIILGRDGMLFAGPHTFGYETLVIAYLSLLCREMFIRNFFVRTFVLDDSLKTIRKLIVNFRKDPAFVPQLRNRLNEGSRDVILMQEILEYLQESLQQMIMPAMPDDSNGRRLYKVLAVPTMRSDIMLRCVDLIKLIEGAHHQLLTLQEMAEVINVQQLEDVFKNVESNTKLLVDASAAQERSSASLQVMQIILAGSFAFTIIDRLSGGTLNVSVPAWVDDIIDTLISVPFLFWVLNMLWLGLVCYWLYRFMKHLGTLGLGFISLRIKVNRAINVKQLEAFLETRRIQVHESAAEAGMLIKKAQWMEDDVILWCGARPKVSVLYDAQYGFLQSVYFQIDGKLSALREAGLMAVFDKLMKQHGVYGGFDPKKDTLSKRLSIAVPAEEEKAALALAAEGKPAREPWYKQWLAGGSAKK